MNIFNLYVDLILRRGSSGRVYYPETVKAANIALKSAQSELGRDIHHAADSLLMEIRDTEFLNMFEVCLQSVACSGDYPYASDELKEVGFKF